MQPYLNLGIFEHLVLFDYLHNNPNMSTLVLKIELETQNLDLIFLNIIIKIILYISYNYLLVWITVEDIGPPQNWELSEGHGIEQLVLGELKL